jgi:hypothetical protein
VAAIKTLSAIGPAGCGWTRIGETMPLPHILDLAYLPALLRDHPAAVVPYLVGRDCFIARLYHQRTGYRQPDGHGLDATRRPNSWLSCAS